ncbi:MAG: hypothetical protein JWO82_4380, partial [Akkermansiaceae bacterium]|nr:hypothetical protein [Akkermansiaceae bacterium]
MQALAREPAVLEDLVRWAEEKRSEA